MDDDPTNTGKPAASEDKAKPEPSRLNRVIARLLGPAPWQIYFVWVFALLLWAAVLALAWICWPVGFPMLWNWAGGEIGRIIAALVGSLFLFSIPVWGGMAAASVTGAVVDYTLTDPGVTLESARERVIETEDDVLKRLESTDQAGLLPLLRYSRAQLDAYYVMGLAQTQRSFLNAAIAMWLGFLILIAGIVLYVGPVEQFGIKRPSGDFNTLILASALIIEVISALFLWVYRSTIGQLTFYYRLQMQSHTAILSYRIASTMDKADDAKRAIIDKLLGSSLSPERPVMSGAKHFGALLSSAKE